MLLTQELIVNLVFWTLMLGSYVVFARRHGVFGGTLLVLSPLIWLVLSDGTVIMGMVKRCQWQNAAIRNCINPGSAMFSVGESLEMPIMGNNNLCLATQEWYFYIRNVWMRYDDWVSVIAKLNSTWISIKPIYKVMVGWLSLVGLNYRQVLFSLVKASLVVLIKLLRTAISFMVVRPIVNSLWFILEIGTWMGMGVWFWITFPYQVFSELYIRWNLSGQLVPLTVPVEVEVPLGAKLDQIIHMLTGGIIKEGIVPGSPMFECKEWPKQVCSMRSSEGKHVGFGFFTVIGSQWVCMTAAHVLQSVVGGSMWTPRMSLAIGNAKLVVKSSADMVGFAVDNNTATNLGCIKMKIARTPSAGNVINIFGYINGVLTKSVGNVSGPGGRALLFKHTASTLRGYCGSPVIRGDKTVVGIHIETDSLGYNYAISTDLLVASKEGNTSEEYNDERDLFGEFDELVVGEDLYIGTGDNDVKVKAGKKRYSKGTMSETEIAKWKLLATVNDMNKWDEKFNLDDDEEFGDDEEDLEELKRWNIRTRVKEGKKPEKAPESPRSRELEPLVFDDEGVLLPPTGVWKSKTIEAVKTIKEEAEAGPSNVGENFTLEKENSAKPEPLTSSISGTKNSARAEKRKRQRERRRAASKKPATETLSSLVNSASDLKVDQEITTVPLITKESSFQSSKTGTGSDVMEIVSEGVLATTQVVVEKEKNPRKSKEPQSFKSCVRRVNIRKLVSQIGMMESSAMDRGMKEKLNSLTRTLNQIRESVNE